MLFFQQVTVAFNVDKMQEIWRKRKLHIKTLNNLAAEIDLNSQNFNNGKWKGNSVTFASGALSAISGLATLYTGGLVLPVVSSIGFAMSAGGSAWNFLGSSDQTKTENEIIERIKKICREDDEIQEDIRHEVAKFEMLDDNERYKIGEATFAVLKGFGGVAFYSGPENAIQAMKFSMPPIKQLLKGVPGLVVLLGSYVKTAAISFTGKSKEGFDEATEGHAATQVEGKALEQGLFKEKDLKELMVGVAVIGCIWDAYHIQDAWGKSKDESKTTLGEALRRIARELERGPSNVDGA